MLSCYINSLNALEAYLLLGAVLPWPGRILGSSDPYPNKENDQRRTAERQSENKRVGRPAQGVASRGVGVYLNCVVWSCDSVIKILVSSLDWLPGMDSVFKVKAAHQDGAEVWASSPWCGDAREGCPHTVLVHFLEIVAWEGDHWSNAGKKASKA